jgi:hypothetical protein
MTGEPYNIGIFVADGDPDGVRVLHRPGWTWRGVAFRRIDWKRAKLRDELNRAGVYVLLGYDEEGENETLLAYVGSSGRLVDRLDQHVADRDSKSFWERAVAFTAIDSLNAAQAAWLEWSLIRLGAERGQARLLNRVEPNEPTLSEFDRADMQAALPQILKVLPLVGVPIFEKPTTIVVRAPGATSGDTVIAQAELATLAPPDALQEDTIVVPAREDGFQRVFLGENAWWAVRIASWRLAMLKWIAAYRVAPTSAITHVAPIATIEPYGESGKWKIVFASPAESVGPVRLGDQPTGPQAPFYTSYARLKVGRTLADLRLSRPQ